MILLTFLGYGKGGMILWGNPKNLEGKKEELLQLSFVFLW